jgi:hypothetical protein
LEVDFSSGFSDGTSEVSDAFIPPPSPAATLLEECSDEHSGVVTRGFRCVFLSSVFPLEHTLSSSASSYQCIGEFRCCCCSCLRLPAHLFFDATPWLTPDLTDVCRKHAFGFFSSCIRVRASSILCLGLLAHCFYSLDWGVDHPNLHVAQVKANLASI